MSAAAEVVRSRAGAAPVRLGLVLGSGLGGLAESVQEAVRIPYADLPGFPVSGVSGHAGEMLVGRLGGARVALLAGRAHYYEQGDARAMDAPIAALKALGAEAIALSNAAGSTREETGPGALMAISDHINLSGANPLIGAEGDARFVSMVDAYDPELRARLRDIAEGQGAPIAEGVYAWFSGPSFETPAEINMARVLGADAVGMSTAPETILARYHGLKVAAVSVITNYAAGMTGRPLSHVETKEEGARAATRLQALLTEFAGSFA